jgi:hypothetical protein
MIVVAAIVGAVFGLLCLWAWAEIVRAKRRHEQLLEAAQYAAAEAKREWLRGLPPYLFDTGGLAQNWVAEKNREVFVQMRTLPYAKPAPYGFKIERYSVNNSTPDAGDEEGD